MATRKIARARKGPAVPHQPVLRNYSAKEPAALAEPHPWPVRDRKDNRAAQKALAEAMDRIADQACHAAFDASFAESMRLRYPRGSTRHFLRMFFRAMNGQIRSRMEGAGVQA